MNGYFRVIIAGGRDFGEYELLNGDIPLRDTRRIETHTGRRQPTMGGET